MLTYSQSTGRMSRDGVYLWTGYAGNGSGLNNRKAQELRGKGPLPAGFYTLEYIRDNGATGPHSIFLKPDAANTMFGRGAFFIHGDNSKGDRSASDGCIIKSPQAAREQLRIGERLQVVP